jgi:diguanylate cyclase (GGDEF)-like protein
MGTVDQLTGAYNRTFFEAEVLLLETSQEYPISIIMADIDNLKVTNDTQGHAAGDGLLRKAATVLKSVIRSSDFIARIGGDEFALILSRTGEKDAQQVVKRIQEIIQAGNLDHADAGLNLSIGMATTPDGNLIETLRTADSRMYQNKQEHKGYPFDPQV